MDTMGTMDSMDTKDIRTMIELSKEYKTENIKSIHNYYQWIQLPVDLGLLSLVLGGGLGCGTVGQVIIMSM